MHVPKYHPNINLRRKSVSPSGPQPAPLPHSSLWREALLSLPCRCLWSFQRNRNYSCTARCHPPEKRFIVHLYICVFVHTFFNWWAQGKFTISMIIWLFSSISMRRILLLLWWGWYFAVQDLFLGWIQPGPIQLLLQPWSKYIIHNYMAVSSKKDQLIHREKREQYKMLPLLA